MNARKTDTVIRYLDEQKAEDALFIEHHMNGECYQLARRLTALFGGTVYASNHDNHAVARIYGYLFDAGGLISKKNADDYHEMLPQEHILAREWHY